MSQPASKTRNTFLERFQPYAQRIRVPSGFVLAALYLYLAHPTPRLLLCGGILAVLGVGLRAWASGHLRKNETLTVSGPYLWTRNPLYLGSLVMGLGCAIAGGSWLIAGTLVLFFLMIYLPVMRAEAQHLTHLFPAEYPDYAARVPLLLPRLAALPNEALQVKFDSRLYWRYREYRAALGIICVFGFLLFKLLK